MTTSETVITIFGMVHTADNEYELAAAQSPPQKPTSWDVVVRLFETNIDGDLEEVAILLEVEDLPNFETAQRCAEEIAKKCDGAVIEEE